MTNKEQIIIDGVNVKDCRRRIGKDNYCRYFKRLCSDNNFNCVWKQLARKTQEYEQLEEKYEALKLENQEGYEIVAELKHECEEYKKQLEFERTHRTVIDAERNRYRKALMDIEEYINQYEMLGKLNIKYILYIINKAKGEGNE